MTVSAWSQEVWTDTLSSGTPPEPGDPGDPIFYDDFERYPIGTRLNGLTPPISVNGARWTSAGGDDPPSIVSGGYGGSTRCLGFDMRDHGDYAFSEQRFKLTNAGAGSTIDELWIEFYVFWPSNFDTKRDSHNKTIIMWNESASYWKGFGYSPEAWWSSSNRTQLLGNIRTASSNWGHGHTGGGSPPFNASNYDGSANNFNPTGADSTSKAFWNKATDNGNWRQYRLHFKASSPGGSNGVVEAWKGGVKITEFTGLQWYRGSSPGLDVGYLFGWWSTSVVQACIVKMDRVAMHTSDPGW